MIDVFTRKNKAFFLFFCGFLLMQGCAIPAPRKDYTFAEAAVSAASEARAPTLAPHYWHKAQSLYREAQSAFEKKDYTTAKKLFRQSRKWAEMAENASRLKQFKTGDMMP